jgi:hypothetical protein
MSTENENNTQNGEVQNSFDIASFNENFGTSFEDVGSLKETLSYKDKFNELNSQHETLSNDKTEWTNKYSELENKYNGVLEHFTGEDVINKLYGSEQTWQRVQLEKKFADKDPGVVSQVYNSDLNSLADDDVLLLADKMSYSVDLPDSDRKQAILETLLGNDVDLTELDARQKYKLSKAVAEARTQLSEIKNYKPEKPTFDWLEEANNLNSKKEEQIKNLEAEWGKNVSSTLADYTGAKFFTKDGDQLKEVFSYDADDKWKQEIAPNVISDFVRQGLDPNDPKNAELLTNYIDGAFKVANIDKVVKKALEQAAGQAEDKVLDEIHNNKEKNDNEAPPINNEGEKMGYLEYMRRKKK